VSSAPRQLQRPRSKRNHTNIAGFLAMDITKFVSEFRESAFLLGDYSTYHTQLSRRLRIVEKKLGRATPKNAKYAAKAPITAEDIAKNNEYAGNCAVCIAE